MLTIKAMVKKDGLRVDRKYNVKLCFTYNRKVKRLSTSLFASPEDLTKSLSFKDVENPERTDPSRHVILTLLAIS